MIASILWCDLVQRIFLEKKPQFQTPSESKLSFKNTNFRRYIQTITVLNIQNIFFRLYSMYVYILLLFSVLSMYQSLDNFFAYGNAFNLLPFMVCATIFIL